MAPEEPESPDEEAAMGAGTWESHHAITTLMYRYTELIDAADFDGIGALFAHGGITQVGVPGMIEGADAVSHGATETSSLDCVKIISLENFIDKVIGCFIF